MSITTTLKKENNPKVSVVMAVYNAEKYVAEAIDSVLNQTFKDFEFIIINDCSPDNSIEVLRKYSEKDKRIILIDNERNLGAAAARNIGLKIANGQYIAIFDADDVCLPTRLADQVSYLDNEQNVFLVSGSYQMMNSKGIILDTNIINLIVPKVEKLLVKKNIITNCAVMFRNTGYLYRDKFFAAEDYDLWLRMLSDGRQMTVLPNIAIKYRMQEKSISHSNNKKLLVFVNTAKKYYKQRKINNKDNYDSLNISNFCDDSKKIADDGVTAAREIKFYFKNSSDPQALRKAILIFWRKYGFGSWSAAPFYYLISYLPEIFRNKIKKYLWG